MPISIGQQLWKFEYLVIYGCCVISVRNLCLRLKWLLFTLSLAHASKPTSGVSCIWHTLSSKLKIRDHIHFFLFKYVYEHVFMHISIYLCAYLLPYCLNMYVYIHLMHVFMYKLVCFLLFPIKLLQFKVVCCLFLVIHHRLDEIRTYSDVLPGR